MLSLFLCSPVWADTLIMKNNKEVRGLIVEQHEDRYILSTENGEIPILRKSVKEVQFDSPEQNFMNIATSLEKAGKLDQALAYYNKAIEANPNSTDARNAALGVRNRLTAVSSEGPRNEVEKQQLLLESWTQGKNFEDVAKEKKTQDAKSLREGLGVTLEKKGDWVRFEYVDPKKPGGLAGLKRGDRLVSIDGLSLRYLQPDSIMKTMLVPRFSSFTLEYERDVFLHLEELSSKKLNDLGLKLKLEYQGIVVHSVKKGSEAQRAGLLPKDLIVSVDGQSTRYMPIKKLAQLVEKTAEDRSVFTVRRSAVIARR